MTKRITEKRLQAQLDQLNKTADTNYELNNAVCYGGYTITANNGSSHLVGRMPPKEMFTYLMGALDFVSIQRGKV